MADTKNTPTTFNRRHLLGGGLAAGALSMGASGIPSFSQGQDGSSKMEGNAHVYTFPIGDCMAAVISDGQKFRDGGLDYIIADDKNAVASALEAAYEPSNGFSADYNVLVLWKGDNVALFDTGSGGNSLLMDGLSQLGISPDKVTEILISHCHGDHIGGILDDNGKRVFPNATAHVLKEERDFWMGENPDFSECKLPAKNADGMVKSARKVIEALEAEGALEIRSHGDTLWDGIVTYKLAAGHTPGHAVFEIMSGEDRLIHIVDLAHHYVIMFADPSWAIAFDVNPTEAIATRRQIFADLADSKVRVIGYHLPFPAVGHIADDGEGFRWVPDRWLMSEAG
ncbi:MAG: hypothetical protein CMO55_24880 [Verrucomicrobiales bacterium]|nr:hypothetical protein [Verrucomicrobiales bacterium]